MRLSLAFVLLAGAVFAGDPILFYSSSQLSSEPIKQIDRELVRITEAPDTPTPTQAAYAATARERRGSSRSDARRLALMQKRQKSESNWLVDEPSKRKGDAGLGDLGEEETDFELLFGPEDPDLDLEMSELSEAQPTTLDQADIVRRAHYLASREEAAAGHDLSLAGQLDLRSLMAADGAVPPRSTGRGIGSSGTEELRFGGVGALNLPMASSTPGRFQPPDYSPAGGMGPSVRERLGLGSGGAEPPVSQPRRAVSADWTAGGLNGLEFRGRGNNGAVASPNVAEHEKWRRLGR